MGSREGVLQLSNQTATSTLVEVFLDAGLMSRLAERERLQEGWLCYLAQGQQQ